MNTFSVAKYRCFYKVLQILVNNENAYKVKFRKFEYNMKCILKKSISVSYLPSVINSLYVFKMHIQ